MNRENIFIGLLMISFLLIVGCTLFTDRSNGSSGGGDGPADFLFWQKIVASTPVDNDYFGKSASISGDYAICGAPHNNTTPGTAYIYHNNTNVWDSGVQIIAPAASRDNSDDFGRSVSISGDYAIVGAPCDSTCQGSAYIYHRTGTNTWDAGVQLIESVRTNYDFFGYSVAISGNYAIVGTPFNDQTDDTDTGKARIFYRNPAGTTWDAGTEITLASLEGYDSFGWSVAISGDFAIVGAISADGSNSGKAFIFHRTGTNAWADRFSLTGQSNGDCFGYSVSISGNYAIVGARYNDNGGNSRGAAYIYHLTSAPNTWGLVKKLSVSDAADFDYYGYSVAVSGSYAYVSSTTHNTTGNICVFYKDQGGTDNWGELSERLVGSDSANGDSFGNSIFVSGHYIIAGASYEDGAGTNRGAAYIFKW